MFRFQKLKADYKMGFNMLIEAAKSGDAGYVRELCQSERFDINATDSQGSTALHWAAFKGHFGCLSALLFHGAKPDLSDNDGHTPLHLSALEGHTPCVKTLLTYKASIHVVTQDGYTPLHLSARKGHTQCLSSMLVRSSDLEAVTKEGWTALHQASYKGHSDCVSLLLNHAAEADSRTSEGHTPLHLTSQCGHLQCLVILLSHNADASARDNTGWTGLHLAAYGGHTNCISPLLRHKADINAQDNEGVTPLHRAVLENKPKCVTVLLNRGAKGDLEDGRGRTPLDLAIEMGYTECATSLKQHGHQEKEKMDQRFDILVNHDDMNMDVCVDLLKNLKVSTPLDGFDSPSQPRRVLKDWIEENKEEENINKRLSKALKSIPQARNIRASLMEQDKKDSRSSTPEPDLRRPGPQLLALEDINVKFDRASLLGSGGFGAVYLGYLKTHGNIQVAVKTLNNIPRGGLPLEEEESFLAEATVMSMVTHPNIVSVFGIVRDPPSSTYAIVMEFVERGSLYSLMKKIPQMPWPVKVNIIRDVLKALTWLSNEYRVTPHQDIKTDNIMIDQNFSAKLGDFGLTKVKKTIPTATALLDLSGTLTHMAPELFGGRPKRPDQKN